MTDKPEKITVNQFELEQISKDTYILWLNKEDGVIASRNEFVELAKEILKYETEKTFAKYEDDICKPAYRGYRDPDS